MSRPSGEGSFAVGRDEGPRIEELPERRFAVKPHRGGLASIEETRRPMYQHMIMHEQVGGPPVIRFPAGVEIEERVDVLVGAACGFEGDAELAVEIIPAGWFAIADYEGPVDGLAAAHDDLRAWAERNGHEAAGPLLQVHLMDEIDGETEQQLQLPIRS